MSSGVSIIGHQGPIPIIGVRCHYCSRHFHPQDVIRFGEGIVQCFQCRERDSAAIDAFIPPASCPHCRRSFNELAAAERTEHVKMFPHFIDGEYTLLCERCDWAHVQKRRDLYGETLFGWQRKLK